MKKEKQVRSYKRRTKSGKTVTVKAHTAKYEAADEKAKEVSKKPGAGKELEERKKKPVQLELPFDKEEEKKVLDEVKGEEKKSTSKKSEKSAEKTPVKKGTESKKSVAYSKAKVGDFIKGDGELSTGKVLRAKSDISGKLAKSYAQSERIPIRQAYQELMVASKNEYRKINAFHNGATIDPQKKVRPVGSGTNGPTPKKESKSKATKTAAKPTTSEPAFTAAEFKEWYRGTGSAADKKVARALRAQLGRAGYRKLEDEAIDNYSSRGHLSMFKRVGGGSSATETKAVPKSRSVKTPVKKTAGSSDKVSSKDTQSMKDLGMRVNKRGEIVWTSDYMKHPEKYKDAWKKEISANRKSKGGDK